MQCLRGLLLTHPHVRGEVAKMLERCRGVYRCGVCGEEKYKGHSHTCLKAVKLKLLKFERKGRDKKPVAELPPEYARNVNSIPMLSDSVYVPICDISCLLGLALLASAQTRPWWCCHVRIPCCSRIYF